MMDQNRQKNRAWWSADVLKRWISRKQLYKIIYVNGMPDPPHSIWTSKLRMDFRMWIPSGKLT